MGHFTKEQIDNRTSDYICWDCGHKFLTEDDKKNGVGNVVTAHESECGLCGKITSVTHMRTWKYLRIK